MNMTNSSEKHKRGIYALPGCSAIRTDQRRKQPKDHTSNILNISHRYLAESFDFSSFHSYQCDHIIARAVRHKNAKYTIITCHSRANQQHLRVTDPLVSNVAMTKSMLLQFLHQIKNFKNHVNDLIATCSQSKYNREKKKQKNKL